MKQKPKSVRRTIFKLFPWVMGVILVVLVSLQIHESRASSQNQPNTNETSISRTEDVSKRTSVLAKQKAIKARLTAYLDTVTKDGTVNVSFYNLGAKANSKAAKQKQAAIYQAGSLATEANAHTPQVAASTFKLFISAYLMQQKLNGNFTWTTTNENGFYQMIVNSDNTYADAELESYGMSRVNSFIQKQGWYSPVFTETKVAQTTSHSLMRLLKQLATGTGVFQKQSDRAKILGFMRKQIYRSGIPTGARQAQKGSTVADKVGFLNDVNNDAGIVTLPNGEQYILVIMTHGHQQSGFSGFPKIAKITKRVQTIVYGKSK
ncbi:serine hydrolase [Pediococcus siamensis]|uniref:serine hydrolase n=1 Tax=Pediococcus siamensis TaxID=381829 RepID=UPI0039A31FF4